MIEHDEFGYRPEPKKSNDKWYTIIASLVSVIAAVTGSNMQGKDWFLYVTVILLLLSFAVVIKDTKPIKSFMLKRHERKRIRAISKFSVEYLKFLHKFRLVDEIIKELRNLDWCDEKDTGYYLSRNALHDLEGFINNKSLSDYSKIMGLNYGLSTYIDTADIYINQCDWLVVHRFIKYKDEHDKAKVQNLIQKYIRIKEDYNEFRKNMTVVGAPIRHLSENTLSFTPKEISHPEQQ